MSTPESRLANALIELGAANQRIAELEQQISAERTAHEDTKRLASDNKNWFDALKTDYDETNQKLVAALYVIDERDDKETRQQKRIAELERIIEDSQKQEPVAHVADRDNCRVWWNDKYKHISEAPPNGTPLYASPVISGQRNQS